MALQAGSPKRAAQATPLPMSHPPPNRTENASTIHPLRGSRSRPLFPDRLQSIQVYPILYKFRLSAVVASASARMGYEPVRTAWRRGGVRLDDRYNGRAIRQHPTPPDPPYPILRPIRKSQTKHERGAALPSFDRPHPRGLLAASDGSHAAAGKPGVNASKKEPKTGYVT